MKQKNESVKFNPNNFHSIYFSQRRRVFIYFFLILFIS